MLEQTSQLGFEVSDATLLLVSEEGERMWRQDDCESCLGS